MVLRTFFLLSIASASSLHAADMQFEFPLACELGKTCWIQQYADHDPGPDARDFKCGAVTYDGHDGTDIRVRSTTDSADVIASAAGVVAGTRDGVDDHLMQSEADKNAVANRECGNGVRINHPGNWSTQYCHMKNGSITVRKGDKVEAGQVLGRVGYSGAAAFPHLHLSVQHQKRTVDPFSGDLAAACESTDQPLWSPAAQQKLTSAENQLLDLNFATRELTLPDLEEGRIPQLESLSADTDLVTYAWLINLNEGDQLSLSLKGPSGEELATNTIQLDRRKAQYFLLAGKKKPSAGWTKGTYGATLEIRNGGAVRLQQAKDIVLP